MSEKGKAPASAGASRDSFVAKCRVVYTARDGGRAEAQAGDIVDACDEDTLSLLEHGAIEQK